MPPISRRLPPALDRNRLTSRLEDLVSSGTAISDLTSSNPTRAGLRYPSNLLSRLSSAEAMVYTPEPFGLESARRAVADDYARRGATVEPGHIVLTASTSESYTWLFKLFCNPGDSVLVPRPSYPLFEHLARLEGVRLETYDLHWHGRWDVDTSAIRQASADVRALIVVTPNNPTGSCVTVAEFLELAAISAQRGWALIADEVFVDYLSEPRDVASDLAGRSAPCLTISLGGLSKSVGLPQLKLGWLAVGGPQRDRDEALSALEIVADSFLSVSTPVQVALPDLLARGSAVRDAIRARIATNLSVLRTLATKWPQCDVLPIDGGWSAVIRVPATRPEEALVLDILERDHVLVHPGFFFDFPHEAYLIISLLVESEMLRSSMAKVLRTATA